MNKLTRRWRRQKNALTQFLALPLNNPAGNPKGTLNSWFDNLVNLPAPATSPESVLEGKLELLVAPRNNLLADGADPSKRRSARLARMVQGTIGGGPAAPGYYVSINDVRGDDSSGGFPAKLMQYKQAVKDASEAAAAFVDLAKNGGAAGIRTIAVALKALIDANPTVDILILDELRDLNDAMFKAVARAGGAGEGDGFWPSTWVSSSSSSSGG